MERRSLAAIAAALLAAPALAGAPAYTATRLAPYDEGWSVSEEWTSGINASGDVAGYALRRIPPPYSELATAILWSGGRAIALAPDPSSSPPDDLRETFATAVNDAGHVAGVIDLEAVLWVEGRTIVLPRPAGGARAFAYGLNDGDDVVGCADSPPRISPGTLHYVPIVWRGGRMGVLPEIPGAIASCALAVNDAGWIAGSTMRHDDPDVYAATAWIDGQARDLPVPPGTETSEALAINARGQIAGYLCGPDACGAAIWTNFEPRVLPGGGQAKAINASGDAVGQVPCNAPGGPAMCGALWRDGSLYLLNDLLPASARAGIHVYDAVGINDAGQIAVVAYADAPTWQAFRLDPVVDVAALLHQLLDAATGVGPGKSLASKVRAALSAYDADDAQETCSALGAFANETRAQRGKKLSPPLADGLLRSAEQIRSALACAAP